MDLSYQWSVVLHPTADEFGNMNGINTASLKLTQLVEGKYQFKVEVSGEKVFGEATVNVTVLARKCTCTKNALKYYALHLMFYCCSASG